MLLVLVLPMNLWIQLKIQHKNQAESSKEVFAQLEQLIQMNTRDIENGKEEFSERCIRSAEMVSYFVKNDPEITKSVERAKQLAEMLDIDEIHFFTPEGEIYSGTHPKYFGYTFESGEQMRFFLPMLEDKSLRLCQEIQPNTAEGKEMQYAAVWMEDGSGIVQIGMEPRRLLKVIEEKSLKKVISSMPIDFRGFLHIVDRKNMEIIASTADNLVGQNMAEEVKRNAGKKFGATYHYNFNGKRCCVYSKDYGDYILIRTYLAKYPIRESILSTIMVLVYIGIVAIVTVSIIGWYVNKKLVGNLTMVVTDLKKIEDGNMENVALKTGIIEFDELIEYINQLLNSIRSSWKKLSHIIDKGQISIGIFEDNHFYKKIFVNERLLEILGIYDYEEMSIEQLKDIVQDKLEQAEAGKRDSEEDVCVYNRNGEQIYLRIEKSTDEQSTTYYVTDLSLWWGEIQQLRDKSNLDVLTGLYNRRGFSERMSTEFHKIDSDDPAAILMLDADGLKKINDIYGHRSGDEYLKRIASMLQTVVNPASICARLGGDEFVVFLQGYDSIQEIEDTVEKIKEHRGEKFVIEKSDVEKETIEFSLGKAVYPTDGRDYHLLMHIADKRMYQEKRERKNRKIE